MKRAMKEGDPQKQVGFFDRCFKLKEFAKSCKILSSGVMMKSPNNITFSYEYYVFLLLKYFAVVLYFIPYSETIFLLLDVSALNTKNKVNVQKNFNLCHLSRIYMTVKKVTVSVDIRTGYKLSGILRNGKAIKKFLNTESTAKLKQSTLIAKKYYLQRISFRATNIY